MNNLNNIPGEIIKTSQLPDDVPSHLIGVILGTSPKTVKYPTTLLAQQVSTLLTDVVKTTGSYSNPSWITSIDWSKLTNVPSFASSLSSLSDVSLGLLSAGQLLQHNGTEWVNWTPNYLTVESDTLATVTTRGNITTNSITVGGATSSYFLLNTTATPTLQAGMFGWNDVDGTANLRLKGNNVTLQLGQETLARVVNKTGADLLESQYKVVRVRVAAEGGAQGQRLAVVLAQGNNDPDSVTTLGIVTEDIGNNQEGFITVFGNVNGINTTGSLQGETWVDGDVLFLSPTIPGSLTKVKPTAPNHTVVMGYVVYAHANNGKIFVKVDNGYELEELHDVAPTPYVNNGVLYRDTATNLWKSATISTLLGGTPLLTIPTLAQVTTAGNTTTNSITVGGLTVATNLIYTDTVNGRVGIGTVSPSQALTIANGSIAMTDSFPIRWGTSNLLYGSPTGLDIASSAFAVRFRFTVGGNLLIGTTTDAGYKLDVNGTTRLNGLTSINGVGVANTALAVYGNGSGAGNFLFRMYDASVVERFYLTASGNFRLNGSTDIGTTGTDEKWRMVLSFAPTSGTRQHNGIYLTQTINQTGGANGVTRGIYVEPTITSAVDFRAIETTVGNVIFGSTSGNVGINIVGPTEKLEVNGNIKATSFIKNGGTSSQFLKADGSIDTNSYTTEDLSIVYAIALG